MAKVLEIYKIFEKHFGEKEAKILTEAVEELIKENTTEVKNKAKEELKGELATKQDLEMLEYRLRAEIEQVRGELKAEIAQVRGEIQKVKNDLLKWLIVLFIGQATLIVGLVFTLI
ncbi:MAG TPA: hypothetical protein EYO62_01360, partial [Aquificales bacterium]|nr:hypothetical protein [Aquificales bacterium]